MGGGGGDGGYEAQQLASEAKKQQARDALNAQFGVGGTAIDKARFTTAPVAATPGGWTGGGPESDGYYTDGTPGSAGAFDQAGYDAALAAADSGKNSRDTLYQTVRDSAFNAGKTRLDEQKADAARKLKFELFARGLNGGSEDVNQNALLGRTYDQGVLDLGAKADSAKAGFRGEDENARLSLLQSIDAGVDQGSAISSAINSMKVNADRASADANATTLGDLFATPTLLYNQTQTAKGKQAGAEWWNQYNPNSAKKTGAVSGVITAAG